MTAKWWQEMDDRAGEHAERLTAAWWASMRDQYLAAYPDADPRSRQNMADIAASVAAREGRLALSVTPSTRR